MAVCWASAATNIPLYAPTGRCSSTSVQSLYMWSVYDVSSKALLSSCAAWMQQVSFQFRCPFTSVKEFTASCPVRLNIRETHDDIHELEGISFTSSLVPLARILNLWSHLAFFWLGLTPLRQMSDVFLHT